MMSKKETDCSNCKALSQRYYTSSPTKLEQFLEKVQRLKIQGVIKELDVASEYYTPIDDVITNGWNDIVYSEFECCVCGKQFKLFADTYHGSPSNGWQVKGR